MRLLGWMGAALAAGLTVSCVSGDDDGGGGGECPSFTACGGDVQGTWQIESVCGTGLEEAMNAKISDGKAACDGAVESLTLEANGGVEFAAGTQTPDLVVSIDMQIRFTPECLSAQAGGPVTVSQTTCDVIRVSMTEQGSSAECSLSGSDCLCNVTTQNSETEPETYSVNGTKLTVGTDAPDDFCVNGNTLTVKSSLDGAAFTYTAHRL